MRCVGCLVVVVAMVVVATGGASAKEVVDTESGRVSGILEETEKGRDFHSFYGIPFAQPPLGKLRFKDPQTPAPWEGTRDASQPPAMCLQNHFINIYAGKTDFTGGEDCLYLNVFTPEVKEGSDLPVMVWIHGGGFHAGSATEYRPHVLLDHDVVLVAVQYRLGVLGFLSTEDSVMPGNLGLKDQTMALQWVQRNIHRFGGDKTRVTIFGESAGGASVHYQMLTPKAEGLFSRAILQSGNALCPWAVNAKPRETTLRVAGFVGCPADQGSQALLGCLQGLDANVIAPLLHKFSRWSRMPLTFVPWVDGEYLPEHPAQLVLDGRHAQVEIMSGVTRDEGGLFALPVLRKKVLLEQLSTNFSVTGPTSLSLDGLCEDPVAVARQVYLHYFDTIHLTEAHAESLNRMFSDHMFAVSHDLTTAFHASHLHPDKKTFRYELQHYRPGAGSHLICPSCDVEWISHTDELFYLFRGFPFLTLPPDWQQDLQRPEDLSLRDIMTTLWTNFAATGNPTPDDSLGFNWEPSTADNLHYLSLTPSPSMQPDNREEARKFFNSLPMTANLILHPHLVADHTGDTSGAAHTSKVEL
ncbi:cholinesterase 2-like isoform X7 [Eriocheir sinensis]|uniref:cholinesterase 2-like isoform X7 n=1 Tax=Eriocheir sinensis TaxID=95602 RepID=UPI0021CA79AB|nr:cholinesterase 2-like isoform X7 [Eriocheir sinensis]